MLRSTFDDGESTESLSEDTKGRVRKNERMKVELYVWYVCMYVCMYTWYVGFRSKARVTFAPLILSLSSSRIITVRPKFRPFASPFVRIEGCVPCESLAALTRRMSLFPRRVLLREFLRLRYSLVLPLVFLSFLIVATHCGSLSALPLFCSPLASSRSRS